MLTALGMDKRFSFPVFADDPSQGPPPPTAWVTWFLVGSTVAMFIAQLVVNSIHHDDLLGNALAFSPDALDDGRYWTLLTYAWAHSVAMDGYTWLFWLHIVSNMIPLICLGPALEDMLGHVRFLGLYLGGAIASALVWYLSDNSLDPTNGIIGASGAVFAVIAGIGTAAPRERVMVLLFFVLPIGTRMRWVALIIVATEVVQIVFHWLPEMAHWAHLGGAAFGFLYTWFMLPKGRIAPLAN